jgi:hypothetical protein
MNLEEAWFIIYTERHPELSEEKRRAMATWAASNVQVPPPSIYERDIENPTAREVVVGSVGYVGAVEAWDLHRRLLDKGGLARILDFFPGKKEQVLNILGMLGGIGGMATVLAAFFGGSDGARFQYEAFAVAYGAFHYSAQQFAKRLAADRQASELKAVTIATAAASAPEEASKVIAAGAEAAKTVNVKADA